MNAALRQAPDGTLEMSDLSPHVKVLEASAQMSDITAAAVRQQQLVAGLSSDEKFERIKRGFGGPEQAHKPCPGCADKAKAIQARIDRLQSDLASTQGMVIRLMADVEMLKAR